MSVFDRIRSFSFDKNRDEMYGIKSGIVWGYSSKINASSPLLYISKPKYVSQEEFEELLDAIDINFKVKPS